MLVLQPSRTLLVPIIATKTLNAKSSLVLTAHLPDDEAKVKLLEA